jgi:hypothetical protein
MTPKQLTLTPEQLKSVEQGSRTIVVKIDNQDAFSGIRTASKQMTRNQVMSLLVKVHLDLEQGDEVYIVPESDKQLIGLMINQLDSMMSKKLHFTIGEIVVKAMSEVDSYQASNFGIFNDEDEWLDWLKAQNIDQSDTIALVNLIKKEK